MLIKFTSRMQYGHIIMHVLLVVLSTPRNAGGFGDSLPTRTRMMVLVEREDMHDMEFKKQNSDSIRR